MIAPPQQGKLVAAQSYSFFSWELVAGQLGFLLLVVAIFQRSVDRVRAFVAIAASIGFAHALFMSGSGLLAFWWGVLLLGSLLLIGKRQLENAKVRFTSEEEEMLSGLLARLPRSRARHLLDQGFWLSGREGDTLTREDEAVTHLYYLASGEARVMSHGRQVATCRAGDLIGELTVLSGDRASATVVLAGPARFWCAPANVLRPYIDAHDDVRHALEEGIATSLRAKLRHSNELIAEAGGVPA
jgi:CRP-like cAMP-binding protein